MLPASGQIPTTGSPPARPLRRAPCPPVASSFMASSERKPNNGLLIALGFVAILLVGGWVAYPRVKDFLDSRPDAGDYHADTKLLDQLKTATLPAAPTTGPAGQWPQWRGPNRDGVSPETA